MKGTLVLLCAVLLTGCLSKTMSSWVGESRDNLIQRWGPPTSEAKLANGGTSLVYVNTWSDQFSIQTCRKIFNTDAQGIIQSWSYYGC